MGSQIEAIISSKCIINTVDYLLLDVEKKIPIPFYLTKVFLKLLIWIEDCIYKIQKQYQVSSLVTYLLQSEKHFEKKNHQF